MTENILTDGHLLSAYTCKCCIVLKQFDGLNYDGLAGKCQKRQNFPLSKFCAIWYSKHMESKTTELNMHTCAQEEIYYSILIIIHSEKLAMFHGFTSFPTNICG